MHWGRFAEEQPDLAALGQQRLGQQRLGGPGVVLVGTVRADGTARISPVEPLFWEDDLWLSMLWDHIKQPTYGAIRGYSSIASSSVERAHSVSTNSAAAR